MRRVTLIERLCPENGEELYTAVGFRVALHPQVDLATEPRWGRQLQTFGEDADLTSRLGAAYIRGFQGEEVGPESLRPWSSTSLAAVRKWTVRMPTSSRAASRCTRATISSTT
ncbi:MAG TPA: glycoside hydrolase family 3 N-terminal domain-containing protein [Galbitalea sp.]